MPRKKSGAASASAMGETAAAAVAGGAREDGDGGASAPFRWTAENERKLLLLTLGREMNGDEYERLAGVFVGTTFEGIRQRCNNLRRQQRKLFEEYGWDLEAAAPARKGGEGMTAKKGGEGTTAKKRGGEENGGGVVKKARGKKGEKKDKVVKGEQSGGESAAVKQEVLDEN
ncbi:hypothetical protein J1614_004992 [Plenodomus biglobosus]|nr:hypothetical protein J1614_004992 [Plenodomus biglobosus]